eukprot:201500-Amphidinium_carterae.1
MIQTPTILNSRQSVAVAVPKTQKVYHGKGLTNQPVATAMLGEVLRHKRLEGKDFVTERQEATVLDDGRQARINTRRAYKLSTCQDQVNPGNANPGIPSRPKNTPKR